MDAPPPPSLAALPPEVLRGALLYLPCASRAALRRCDTSLRRAVDAFERDVILGGGGACTDANVKDGGNGSGVDKDAYDAVRRELVNTVRDKMWMSRTRDEGGGAVPGYVRLVPGPCHLRRVIAGDMLSKPNMYKWPTVRENSYYSDARIIDDRLWVLYSDYWYSFEVFDLDTGKAVYFGGAGPEKYYVNDEEECMSMLMTAFDGRHGMLAVGTTLSGSANPHGAWSGPYLTVCDIAENERMVAVDLYRPLMQIVEVNVVSKDVFAVLLSGADGVELQWHTIPQKADWHQGGEKVPVPRPPPPGVAPPPHQCSGECPIWGNCPEKKRAKVWRGTKEFWEEQERMQGGKEGGEETTASYDSRVEYSWWPSDTTMLQSNVLRKTRLEGDNNATMASDGSGMLVVVVADQVQVWHVGSMTLLRVVHPFGDATLRHNGKHSARSLSMHTVLYPIEDVLGPGEGAYYNSNRQEIPQLQSIRQTQGSSNPIDLTTCDTMALLSRFAHLTYDEQRTFEKEHNLEEGSCSPQLDCIVRVAFYIWDDHDGLFNRIMHLDINCFHHIRHRESLVINWEDQEAIEENLEQYNDACEGKCWHECMITNHDDDVEAGGEQIRVLDWSRGGIFDYRECAPSDEERENRLGDIMNRLAGGNFDLDADNPEIDKLCRAYYDTQRQIRGQRFVSALSIDASKLIICTGSEVAVVPFALARPEPPVPEDWQEVWQNTHDVYECSPDHGAWHAFRPLDDTLISIWNDVRQHAERGFTRIEERPNTLRTITADLKECHLKEQSLMEAVEYKMPRMKCPCISWRYLAVLCDKTSGLSDPFSSDSDEYQRLHVFDSLPGNLREDIRYSAIPGVHLNEELPNGEDTAMESSD